MESHQLHGMGDEKLQLEDPLTRHIEEFIENKGVEGITFNKLKNAYPSTEAGTLRQILGELLNKYLIVKLNYNGLEVYVHVMWVTCAQMKNIDKDDSLL